MAYSCPKIALTLCNSSGYLSKLFYGQKKRVNRSFIAGLGRKRVNSNAFVLQHSSEKVSLKDFQEIVSVIAHSVWKIGPDGRLISDSPSWRAYIGQTIEESFSHGWLVAVHPDEQQDALEQWQHAINRSETVNAEFSLQTPGGNWKQTNIRIMPCRDANGLISNWISVTLELPVCSSTMHALHDQNESALEKVMQIETAGIFFFDDQKVITRANNAFCRMSGVAADVVASKSFTLDELEVPRPRVTADTSLQELIETGCITLK